MSRIHPEDREIAIAAEKHVQETGQVGRRNTACTPDGRILGFAMKRIFRRASANPDAGRALRSRNMAAGRASPGAKMEAIGQPGGVAHDFNNLLM
jgi:hypothetical protein